MSTKAIEDRPLPLSILDSLVSANPGQTVSLGPHSYVFKTRDGYEVQLVIPNKVTINQFWDKGKEEQLAWFLNQHIDDVVTINQRPQL